MFKTMAAVFGMNKLSKYLEDTTGKYGWYMTRKFNGKIVSKEECEKVIGFSKTSVSTNSINIEKRRMLNHGIQERELGDLQFLMMMESKAKSLMSKEPTPVSGRLVTGWPNNK